MDFECIVDLEKLAGIGLARMLFVSYNIDGRGRMRQQKWVRSRTAMKSREAKPIVPAPGRENPVGFSNFSNEELLTRLANAPCASRSIPTGQSLEEYLLKVQSAP